MPCIVGIDEAGYGPNLGPFVMTAVSAPLPEDHDGSDLWHLFRDAVRRDGERDDGRPLVADSKVVHNGDNLRALELGVRCLLGPFPVANVVTLKDALDGYCPAAHAPLTGEAWYTGTTALPVAATPDVLTPVAERFAAALAAARVAGLHLRSVIVCTPQFNDLLDRWDTKGAVLGWGLNELLTWEPHPEDDAAPAAYFIDKHGGRNQYAAMLQQSFPDGMVIAEEEGRNRSAYRVIGTKRETRITFEPRADGAHFCVALASMVSKYLREVLMGEFNRFWCGHVPGLKPTAGYPGDAARYYDAIRTTAAKLGISERQIWRRK